MVSIFKSVTKYCKQIKNENEIRYELEKAYNISISGRPGPVLLDIPFNIQKKQVKKLKPFIKKIDKYKNYNFVHEKNEINKLLKKSSKLMFVIGGGIKNTKNQEKL